MINSKLHNNIVCTKLAGCTCTLGKLSSSVLCFYALRQSTKTQFGVNNFVYYTKLV